MRKKAEVTLEADEQPFPPPLDGRDAPSGELGKRGA
jgi:hypothetical protein